MRLFRRNRCWGTSRLLGSSRVAARAKRPAARARFVPRLEALENRCVPSVDPVLVFDPGTTWYLVGNSTSTTADTAQPAALNSVADINVTFGYTQSTFQFYKFDSAGNVAVVSGGIFTLTSATGSTDPTIPTLQNAVSTQLNLRLTLFSTQPALAIGIPKYGVSVEAFNTASGASLRFAVTSSDGSGKTTASSNGILHLQGGEVAVTSGNFGQTLAPSSDISFSKSNGPVAFTLTFPGLNLPASQNFTAIPVYDAGNGDTLWSYGLASNFEAADFTFVNGLKGISHTLGLPGNQANSDRLPISNYNSLVLADSGPGLHLTLSISHEISERSSSSAAQATWTGLRPPLEALLLRPDSSTSRAALPPDQEATRVREVADVHRQDETDSRPMEIMVANILQALQQAKVDDRAKDIAQTAARESAHLDLEIEQAESGPLAVWAWEQRGEPDGFASVVLPLNELLDGIALKEPTNPPGTEESLAAKENELSKQDPLPSRTTTASGWRWVPFAESLIAIFVGLAWPGVVRLGQATSCKHEQRSKKPPR